MEYGFYFPHFCTARNDRKIRRLRKELGIEGYGIFFMLLEVLREQTDFKYPMEDIDLLAEEFDTSEQKVRTVLCNYGLFELSEDDTFFSPKLMVYLEPYFKMKEQRRLAGKASAEKRKSLTNKETSNDRSTTVQHPPNDRSTTVQHSFNDRSTTCAQIKENKIKENKIKENKNNTNAPNDKKHRSEPKPQITFNFETNEFENITDKDIEIWKKAYPAVDINLTLNQIAAWLAANPNKRKKNYKRFITNWLTREQDKGGSLKAVSNVKTFAEIEEEREKEKIERLKRKWEGA